LLIAPTRLHFSFDCRFISLRVSCFTQQFMDEFSYVFGKGVLEFLCLSDSKIWLLYYYSPGVSTVLLMIVMNLIVDFSTGGLPSLSTYWHL